MTSYFPRTMTATLGRSVVPTYDTADFTQIRDQTMMVAPTFVPFKFEPRRTRIDWRMLHGVDVDHIVRDVDLDILERIVSIVAFGDIEAEDTRLLSELNFVKGTNGWLQQDRSNMEKYMQAARIRIRELETHTKMTKRELRRTRKTVKTFEAMAALRAEGGAALGQGNTAVVVAPAQAGNPSMQSAIEGWGGYVRRARKTVKAFKAMAALRAEGGAATGQGNTAVSAAAPAHAANPGMQSAIVRAQA
eukprot:gene15155-21221_t